MVARFSFSWRGSVMSGFGGELRGRDRGEVLLDPALRLRRVEIADDDEHRVVGRVEGLEELRHVLERGGVEVLQVAVEVVRVVPILVGVLRQVEPREAAVGLVEDVDPDLVLDDLLLVLEVLPGDREALHPIGLGPERGLERVRGHDLEVVGEVEARRAVQEPAVGLHELDELHLPEVLGALEHHVLEEVGEPGAVLGLDAESDVVVDRHDRQRRRRVPRQHDPSPLGSLEYVDVDLIRRRTGRGRGGGRLGGDRRTEREKGQRQSHEGSRRPPARGVFHVILLHSDAESTSNEGEGFPLSSAERSRPILRSSSPPGGFRARMPRPSGAASRAAAAWSPTAGSFSRRRTATSSCWITPTRRAAAAGSPPVLLLHGLEGSSYSVYVQGLAQAINRRGWNATALNFRSCARDPRGSTACSRTDGRASTTRARPRTSTSSCGPSRSGSAGGVLFAVGASLGGNVLLKWLGEHPGQRDVRAAVALSTPFDLGASDRHLDTAIGRLYVGNFLATLRAKALAAVRRFPEAAARIDVPRTLSARTFWEFDDAANAPLHGFTGADDYYARASSIGYLPRVATPTLCLSAEDDPFLPREALRPGEGGRRGIGRVRSHGPRWAHRLRVGSLARQAGLLRRAAGRRLARPARRVLSSPLR